MTPVTYTCERCNKPFERIKKRGGYIFCSQKCANCHVLTLGREQLFPYAELGAFNAHIAKRLEVSRATIRRALIKHDLYRLWASRRYKKCASPTVGLTSVITASGATILPSCESAVLMAGGLNCGN